MLSTILPTDSTGYRIIVEFRVRVSSSSFEFEFEFEFELNVRKWGFGIHPQQFHRILAESGGCYVPGVFLEMLFTSTQK